ncbi:MAG: ABC transporter permease [Anaerolineae bacterium]|nr:ABC transporter permease [Anaerolineae bacterium]
MFENVVQGIFSAAFLASILRVTTPILLPSLGALISDRAGVINIGLEGMMLISAFVGVLFSAYAQDWFGPDVGAAIGPWLGMGMGVIAAMLTALLLAFFHLKLGANLILSGIAINILGSAATVAIMFELTGDRGNTSTLASLQMPFIQLPEFIADIPLIGGFIFGTLDNQSIMTWIAFISVAVVSFVLYRTAAGYHLRAVGENPSAAESVGIPVKRVQYQALVISGLFAGLGGIHMSMGYLSLFQRDMTAGRGFIALATPLLGGGTPVGTGLASVVFGFFDALAIRIGSLSIPPQLPQMVPYVATVMALVIYALQGRLRARVRTLRASEGVNFDRRFWGTIQQLSVLHMLLMMPAVVGIIISVSMLFAPNGFGGVDAAYLPALLIALASAVLFAIGLPFVLHVERISDYSIASAIVVTISLGALIALLLSLFYEPAIAVVIGLILALAIWLLLGGWRLLGSKHQAPVPA